MGYVVAATAIVSLAYGIYAGESQAKTARKGRRRQQQAQQQAQGQMAASAARDQGREAQRRRGRQLAIANAARVGAGSQTAAGGAGALTGSVNAPTAGGARTLG